MAAPKEEETIIEALERAARALALLRERLEERQIIPATKPKKKRVVV